MYQKIQFIGRKFIALLLVAVLLSGSTPIAYGTYAPDYTNEAIRLNRLGLFLGTSNGFDLDKPIDRLQGAAMFIRLVGEEEEALERVSPIPFQDVQAQWAMPYVSRMYTQGYSNGISLNSYGTGNMTGDQFAAYILRALGYSEADGDFIWNEALLKLLELNIISQRDYAIISQGPFYRDYAVKLASDALDARQKDSEKTLYEKLYDEESLVAFSNLIPAAVDYGTKIRNYEDMESVFQRMRANLQYSATLNTEGLTLDEIKEWLNIITNTSSADVWGWNLVSTYSVDKNSPIRVTLRWLYSDGYEVAYSYLYPDSGKLFTDNQEEIQSIVNAFLEENISNDMTEREKIKAVHDYLVKTIRYDTALNVNLSITSETASDSYKVYGALVKNVAVCDGYAKSFNMFMDILGIPSDRVVGTSLQNGKSVSHAWNRVYVDGEYYFIDVTWDDPVPDRGSKVLYEYYLVSEDFIERDHVWDPAQFDVKYY